MRHVVERAEKSCLEMSPMVGCTNLVLIELANVITEAVLKEIREIVLRNAIDCDQVDVGERVHAPEQRHSVHVFEPELGGQLAPAHAGTRVEQLENMMSVQVAEVLSHLMVL